ncbi:hypothetical protein EYZ11_011037 [Aspergillus tanneri]|uniref:DNA helicase Pif1-like 2B domain-containing protein n=1 Tax=Aspergillus tanneri TaxID=1220188 RepID=A0A4S3J4G0_9EURO|nr:hypothetical protein EYZ11_011037 [Aspergillus tanneri]
MRLPPTGVNRAFADWLSYMSYKKDMYGSLQLPVFLQDRTVQSLEELCERVFPTAALHGQQDPDFFAGRAILTMRNIHLAELNNQVTASLPGDLSVRYSVDKALQDNVHHDTDDYTTEFLQSVDLPGLPPSILRLKKNMPVMLLRNLRPSEGLCNGTRLLITDLLPHVIKARVLTGDYCGIEHFPVRPCFAITVNKSQGQSLQTVGIDLRVPAFSHGQLPGPYPL